METPEKGLHTFNLTTLFSSIQQGWKLLIIGTILGGLIGQASTFILKPVYETAAVFTFTIDYSRTGLLTDIEEDQAMEIAGDLIRSTAVFDEVISQATGLGFTLDDQSIRENFTAERRFSEWLLKVRADDPTSAARLSNLWSQIALTEFQKASRAAIQADGLRRYILSLETCFQQSTSGMAAQPLCQASDRLKLQAEIEKSGDDLQRWQTESRGIFTGLNYSIAQEAGTPDNPSQHSRASLVLAGSLIGLLVVSLYMLFTRKI
jgi:capsular polysaccharide biosynthesis protein